MKIRSEDILKPGAKLEAVKIDFNDPEVKKFIKQSKALQRQILVTSYTKRRVYERVITI